MGEDEPSGERMWELFFGDEARPWWWALPALAVILVVTPILAWAAAMAMPMTTIGLAATLGVACALVLLRSAAPAILLAMCFVTGGLLWRIPLDEADHGFRMLRDTVLHDGVDALTDRELWCVYGVHVGMEVTARLTGWSMLPTTLRGLREEGPAVRAWDGAGALRDPKVRELVGRMVSSAKLGGTTFGPSTVEWPDWAAGEVSPDVSMSLDCPSQLSGARVEGGLRVEIRCHVDWAESPYIFAEVDTRRLVFDRLLFDALERRGWLHPYDAVWAWTVGLDEPAFSVKGATLLPGERAWLTARKWLVP